MHRADELNAVLPSEEVSSEQIEDTMSMLSNMDITVVESEDHEDGAAAPDGEDGADNDEAGGHAVAIATTVPAITQARTEPAERTDDGVRIYLRDMDSVKLLSRGGEIAIAKRIEAGREAMIVGLCEDDNAHPSLPHPSRGAGAAHAFWHRHEYRPHA
jgi:RNA polymerase primary sigma factor